MPGEFSRRDLGSWFVPPLVIPILLIVAIVLYAPHRFVHLGPAAFG